MSGDVALAARRTVALGAVFAFLGVLFGAMGAHALKPTLSPDALAIFRTGAEYQMFHALGLLAVGVLRMRQPESNGLRAAAWLMVLGMVFFSGSLYVLALTELRWVGMFTPLGGLCLLAAWATLAKVMWSGAT